MKEYKVDNLTVKILQNREEMGKVSAEDIKNKIIELLTKKQEINMIFAAAPSQNDVLKSLVEDKFIEWNRVNAYHMDEYIGLDKNAPQGFGNFLKERIFGLVPFKSVNYIDITTANPEQEAERYGKLLTENPTDIVIMGIGENGHIAFNDPPVADFNDKKVVKPVKLDEICRQQQVNDGCFDNNIVPIEGEDPVNEAKQINYNKLIVTLTDYYNVNNKVVIEIAKSGDKATFTVNGNTALSLISSFTSEASRRLYYDRTRKMFIFDGVQVKYDLPFERNRCYVDVTLGGIHGDTSITIEKLNNQVMNKFGADNSAPELLADYLGGIKKLGDIFTINVPTVTDVLTTVLSDKITVKVTSPAGNVVSSIDGVQLNNTIANRVYKIELSEYGIYYVDFYAQDIGGRRATFRIPVSVVDMVSPELSFADESQLGCTVIYKPGTTVTLKEVICMDDIDGTLSPVVSVTDKHMAIKIISDGKFTPTEEGLYRVTYRAMDTAGNSSILYYFLRFEEVEDENND